MKAVSVKSSAGNRRGGRGSAAFRGALVAVAALLLTGWLAACGVARTHQTLTILAIAPATGQNAAFGNAITQAVDLAVKQHADLGGNYTLTVTHLDEASVAIGQDVAQAVKNTQVIGVVGPLSSQTAVATLPSLAQAGIVTISPTAMLPGLTKASQAAAEGLTFSAWRPAGKPSVFFRMTADDTAAGIAAADVALAPATAQGLASHSVFVVDDGSLSAKAQVAAFERELKAKGGTLAGARAGMLDDPVSVQTTVSAIVDANPDSVFYAGDVSLGAKLRKTLTLTGVPQLPLLTAGAAANNPAWSDEIGSLRLLSAYTTDVYPSQDLAKMSGAQSFVAAFNAAYPGQLVTPQCALAYDAVMDEISAIKALIAAHTTPTRAAVLHAIATGAYSGVTGKVAFDANGDPVTPSTFSLYSTGAQGAWTYQSSITPKPAAG